MLAPDTPAGIKPLQIIYLAFGAGVMMFVLATLVLGGAQPAQAAGSPPRTGSPAGSGESIETASHALRMGASDEQFLFRRPG